MITDAPLGKTTVYIETYSPDLLFPIPRTLSRDALKLDKLPFSGCDVWNGYEISWLNLKGMPQIACAEFVFPCESPFIIESKSFKLYLNSFNQSSFESMEAVRQTMEKDLSYAAQEKVEVRLSKVPSALREFQGVCLDNLDIEINTYHLNPDFLTNDSPIVEESLFSNLLKSNCLATGQPDWGSLFIHYRGCRINHEGLLRYIISLRSHAGFAEHCVEQIYHDILKHCGPELLTVYARYTRRGGLDINPFRSNFEPFTNNNRHLRQ